MRQRSRWMGIGAGVLGLTLTLVPLTAASAKSTKGSAPNSAMCKTVKSEQTGSTAASSAIEKAMTSGNYAAAKQALLNSFNVDFNQVQKALSVIQDGTAQGADGLQGPALVRQATADGDSELHQRDEPCGIFRDPGQEPEVGDRRMTISNWYTSVCGGTLTVDVPSTVASP